MPFSQPSKGHPFDNFLLTFLHFHKKAAIIHQEKSSLLSNRQRRYGRFQKVFKKPPIWQLFAAVQVKAAKHHQNVIKKFGGGGGAAFDLPFKIGSCLLDVFLMTTKVLVSLWIFGFFFLSPGMLRRGLFDDFQGIKVSLGLSPGMTEAMQLRETVSAEKVSLTMRHNNSLTDEIW